MLSVTSKSTEAHKAHIPATGSPKELFGLFLDEELWTLLVDMINRNAVHKTLAGHDKGVW